MTSLCIGLNPTAAGMPPVTKSPVIQSFPDIHSRPAGVVTVVVSGSAPAVNDARPCRCWRGPDRPDLLQQSGALGGQLGFHPADVTTPPEGHGADDSHRLANPSFRSARNRCACWTPEGSAQSSAQPMHRALAGGTKSRERLQRTVCLTGWSNVRHPEETLTAAPKEWYRQDEPQGCPAVDCVQPLCRGRGGAPHREFSSFFRGGGRGSCGRPLIRHRAGFKPAPHRPPNPLTRPRGADTILVGAARGDAPGWYGLRRGRGPIRQRT